MEETKSRCQTQLYKYNLDLNHFFVTNIWCIKIVELDPKTKSSKSKE